MLVKSRALVLSRLKYNDQNNVVCLFTEAFGNVPFLVRIPKTQRSGVKSVLLQPLNQVVVEWNHQERQSLAHIRNLHCEYTYTTLHSDFYKTSIVSFLSEFLYYALRNESQGGPLFNYICSSLQWLDAADIHYNNFHIAIQIHLSLFLGFLPNVSNGSDQSFFDLRNGCYTSDIPFHNDYLKGTDALFVKSLVRMSVSNMHLFHFTSAQRVRLLEYINSYYRLHIPDFPPLKSIGILHDMFSE